ncbi:hypothetical protein FRC08_007327 [Ceratobasidium sp. 394]|nr:hypothetical protein FRC08_007327 [Ceratobasidium sp. 394]
MPPLLDSPSHFVSDPSWGPPLHEYLTRPEANLLFSRLPKEAAILRALDDFFYERDVTYKTLETIMTIIYRPHMLCLLVDQRAVVSCMSLLENYVARESSSTGGLFEHAFGFLGLHVLALILQVGILRYFDDWLEILPPVLEDDTEYPWSIKAPILYPGFISVLQEYLDNDNNKNLAPSSFFGWIEILNQDRELASRYSLASGLREESLMEGICIQCALRTKQGEVTSGPVFAVNFEDAQLMQYAYTRQFYPNKYGTHKKNEILIFHLSYFVRDNLEENVSLGLNLGETTVAIIWDMLCCAGEDTRWTFLDRFMSPALGPFLYVRHFFTRRMLTNYRIA